MKPTVLSGTLEIDHDRGVIYFHADEGGLLDHGVPTPLRVCNLPRPIPAISLINGILDITLGHGTSWVGETRHV